MALLGPSIGAGAQAKRSPRPIQLVCPWAAGGGTDLIARMVASMLEKPLGRPVTVVNRTGGSGAIGHTVGATAAPDGNTITIVTTEITQLHWQGIAPITYADFTPVALLNVDPAAVQVAASARWRTLKELLDQVRAHPGTVKASGGGRGGVGDLARAGLLKAAGFSLDALPWVPGTGVAPAFEALKAGTIDVVTASLPESRSRIEAGEVRPLAIMADQRDPNFPDVPTLKELGVDWTMGAWRGIALPKGAPADVRARLEGAIADIAKSATFLDFMKHNGFTVVWVPAVGFERFMAEQDRTMGRLMKELGIAR
jgi:tripartite-type tricarboxylate transporter receptor subunit TctC